jgi:hypothetical protein
MKEIIKKIAEKMLCDVRVLMSFFVIGISFYGIMTIACYVYSGSADKESNESAKYIFNALFPVLSTWIGTIIAFYFSKENFEAANKRVQEMVDKLTPMQKLKSIPVRDKMIKFDSIIKYTLIDKENNDKLIEIRNSFSANYERLLLLGNKNEARFIIHRSIIEKFIAYNLLDKKASKESIDNLTLKNLLDDKDIGIKLKNSFAVVKEDATLADAKEKMDSVKDALDVIVTKSGDKSEPVIGWITNVIIEENSKL